MKKHKNKIIAGVVVLVVLAFAFWYGGNAPGLRGWTIEPENGLEAVNETEVEKKENPENISLSDAKSAASDAISDAESKEALSGSDAKEPAKNAVQESAGANTEEIPIKLADEPATEENKPQNSDNSPMTPSEKEALAEQIANENNVSLENNGDKAYSESKGMVIDESTGKDKYLTDPVPEGKPVPVEPENAIISNKELTCILSVRCDTIIDNIAWLDKEKVDIVPADGVIFAEKTVTFYEGESVFNLLLREMKKNKIHMEFENTPIYNSAYIEGIANLYEFDCGELSGWMYKVNDWFPNYGCSRYQLKEGDRVEWVYTCNLGVDVGGYYATGTN